MLVSIPVHLDTLPGRLSVGALNAALAEHYAGSELVAVLDPAHDPEMASGRIAAETLTDTDRLELRVYGNETYRQAVLVARLDNLGKGASGAAVQNVRLMTGL
jgi:N-acetyl-gamma-glutamyl-phosphate reductase